MEMIMSALALRSASEADQAAPGQRKVGLLERFTRAREEATRRYVVAFLASRSDSQLADMGYAPEEIQQLRRGRLKLPTR
jgi:hypothetical protein